MEKNARRKESKRYSRNGRYLIIISIAFAVVLLDQISKAWIMANLPIDKTIRIVPGFFDLINIRNRGAAFGFLNSHDIEWQFWLFMLATAVAIIAIFFMARNPEQNKVLFCGLGLILGGALGNLIDRLRFRAVVDFLDFYWRGWHWPAFNVADIGICLGAFLVCLLVWQNPAKDGDCGA